MAITADEALELAQKLGKRLDARAPGITKSINYFNGKHNLRFATRKYREAFGGLFKEFSDSYCGLVVDSTAERLRVEGFRIPTEKAEREAEEAAKQLQEEEVAQKLAAAKLAAAAPAPAAGSGAAPAASGAGGPGPAAAEEAPDVGKLFEDAVQQPEVSAIAVGANTGDDEAWELWQRNSLDLYSDMAHETALVTGYAYLLVGPQDDGSTEQPLITVEHPLEVICDHADGNTKVITAAVKRWWDSDSGYAYLTLYTPDAIFRYQSQRRSKKAMPKNPRWIAREGVQFQIDNPFDGIVPVVPLINKQDLAAGGRSEIADIMPIQDAINKLCNDMLVASEFAAFRQRILTGMEIPEDENGDIIPDFDLKAAIDRIMIVKDENVGIHEFAVTDLGQYIKAIEHLRNDIAAITRTPPQYLIGEVVNSSSEALKAAESGLVKKVQKRQRFFGEAWEEAMRLAFMLKGDKERAESYRAETIWANPEVMTEAALADSLAKYLALGVPIVALWERMGASQTEIKRWLELKKTEPPEEAGFTALPAALVRAGEKEIS